MVDHPVFARVYAPVSRLMEREIGEYRRQLLDGLSGQVIEVGAGNGLNFRHYPEQVTSVLAVEPEGHLRDLARRAAATSPVPVEVIPGVADALPAADGSMDAAVASMMLCSVPDQASALAEMARVLRPRGQLRFFEHVAADTPGLHRVQRAVDATLWPLLAGGCHTSRRTLGSIEDAGFEVVSLRRLRTPETRLPLPTSPHVLGSAVRR
jgi:ubiquinone/menaquinone biosynthesis C-methylase UbiE